MTTLSMAEQFALIETIGATPLRNVISGSVTADELDNGKTLIRWRGVAIIPELQYTSVLAAVEAESKAREAGATAPDLTPSELAEVTRFGIHEEDQEDEQ